MLIGLSLSAAYFTQATVEQLSTVDQQLNVTSVIVPEGWFRSARTGKVRRNDGRQRQITFAHSYGPDTPPVPGPSGHSHSHSAPNTAQVPQAPSFSPQMPYTTPPPHPPLPQPQYSASFSYDDDSKMQVDDAIPPPPMGVYTIPEPQALSVLPPHRAVPIQPGGVTYTHPERPPLEPRGSFFHSVGPPPHMVPSHSVPMYEQSRSSYPQRSATVTNVPMAQGSPFRGTVQLEHPGALRVSVPSPVVYSGPDTASSSTAGGGPYSAGINSSQSTLTSAQLVPRSLPTPGERQEDRERERAFDVHAHARSHSSPSSPTPSRATVGSAAPISLPPIGLGLFGRDSAFAAPAGAALCASSSQPVSMFSLSSAFGPVLPNGSTSTEKERSLVPLGHLTSAIYPRRDPMDDVYLRQLKGLRTSPPAGLMIGGGDSARPRPHEW